METPTALDYWTSLNSLKVLCIYLKFSINYLYMIKMPFYSCVSFFCFFFFKLTLTHFITRLKARLDKIHMKVDKIIEKIINKNKYVYIHSFAALLLKFFVRSSSSITAKVFCEMIFIHSLHNRSAGPCICLRWCVVIISFLWFNVIRI